MFINTKQVSNINKIIQLLQGHNNEALTTQYPQSYMISGPFYIPLFSYCMKKRFDTLSTWQEGYSTPM